MLLRALILVLVLVSGAVAQPASLLGQTMLRAGLSGLEKVGTNVGVDLAEEVPLQRARGEKTDEERAFRGLWDGSYLVDAATWVAGHEAVQAALKAAGVALGPFTGSLVAMLGAELVSNVADNAFKGKRTDPVDLAGRSIAGALGGTIGQALLPEFPVLGYLAGVTVADVLWERVALMRKPAAPVTTSKPVEWYAGDAPPLGAYRAPTLRGAPLL